MINHYYWYRLRLELGTGGIHSSLYYFPNQNVGSIEKLGAVKLENDQAAAQLIQSAGLA